MAWQSFTIEKYETNSVAYNTPGFPTTAAFIRLFWEGDHGATLWFQRGSTPSSTPNHYSAGVGAYYAMFGEAQYRDAIDLLRNEKPAFFEWNDPDGARLRTGQEPVGEEEVP
jgi:hypothetical protein